MKLFYFLSLFILTQATIHAQEIISFPDANFKQALLDHTPAIDTDSDGEISKTEAGNVTGTLSLDNKSIGDLAGIEHFTALKKLTCKYNSLTSLDVSDLDDLEELYCENNSLTYLNVSGLSNLEKLYCEVNDLESLTVSGLSNLEDLRCSYNDLISLDVSSLTNLETLSCRDNKLTSIDLSGLTKLKWFSCENNQVVSLILGGQSDMTQLIASYNNLTTLDLRNISLEKIHVAANSCLRCVIVDDVNDVPIDVSGSTRPIPYTEEPCEVPAITCKNYTVELNSSGSASITAINVLNGRTRDICGYSSMSVSPSSFTCSDVGENEVTLTVHDLYGNTNTCKATVTVVYNVKPIAKCKDITIQLNTSGNASISAADIDDGSSSVCGGVQLESVSPSSFTCSDVGENEVTLTVKDDNGNTSTCKAIVTVEDNVKPVAKSKNITIQLNSIGNASISATDIDNGSTDDCGIEFMSVSPSSFICADVGDNEVTLTVRDKGGNESTSTSTVKVVDNVVPEVQCEDITVQLDASGQATITAADVDNGSSDACGIKSMTVSPNVFSCEDVGSPVTVTLTVTDNNDNVSSCTSKVTVEDNILPDVKCQDITVQLDASGQATITAADVDNGSSDVCGIKSMSVSPNTFNLADVGTSVSVTLTVTDNNDNFYSCISTVAVEDNVKPEAKCKDITVQLDANGQTSITGNDVDNGSSDASGIKSMTVSPNTFSCEDVSSPVTVTLTVTDNNGNIKTCTSKVTVEDNRPPEVRTHNQTIFLDNYGKAIITPEMIDDGSLDNCTITSMWLEGLTEFDCGSTGVHEVILKARDQSGHVAQGNALVTVKFYKPDFESMLNITNGDTLHQVNCQVPREMILSAQDLATIKTYGQLTTTVNKVALPENAPWSQYSLWRTDYVMKDACAHTYRFSFYQALYDLSPPVFQFFPPDTTVATISDVPEVDEDVKIYDVCQYVVWDTVVTLPFLDMETGDTIGFTRRWISRDPSGHESFRDQMIWIDSSHQDRFGLIQGRISDESHVLNARFSGEAGTDGIPLSLYWIDENSGKRKWVTSTTTGDQMGIRGRYYFVPLFPGKYQVKMDSSICMVDTIPFDIEGWSDTLELSAGESMDQGWVLTQSCPDSGQINSFSGNEGPKRGLETLSYDKKSGYSKSFKTSWHLFPNPSSGYLRIETEQNEYLEYRMYNTLGRSVNSGLYHRGGTIDIQNLPSGVYHLQLYSRSTGRWDIKKVFLMK